MLGSAADAEDVLQEVWLRWADVERDDVRDPRAYLVRITTRLALNRLRTLRAAPRGRTSARGCPSRCSPRPTSPTTSSSPTASRPRCCSCWRRCRRPSGRSSCCARSSTSPYDEIAAAVDKSRGRGAPDRAPRPRPRARPGARARRSPRPSATRSSSGSARPPRPATCRRLMDVLAPDVVLMTDGGGKVKAALNPILGRDKVLPLPHRRRPGGARARAGLAQRVAGDPVRRRRRSATASARCSSRTASSPGCYLVRNPDKLASVGEPSRSPAEARVSGSVALGLERARSDARTSASASVRPTQLAPSTDLPGSRSL